MSAASPSHPGRASSNRIDSAALDAADPLAGFRARFLPAPGVVAYLDGNSLGRPAADVPARMRDAIERQWGERLIRSWDEGWLDRPLALGDRLGEVVLGAAPGQVVVGDSTTVLLYKLIRGGIELARAGGAVGGAVGGADGATPRDEVVVWRGDFPTDRYVVEGIAAERGMRIRWIGDATDAERAGGAVDADAGPDAPDVTPESVAAVLSERTALVVLSHIAYRSGALADLPAITRLVHDAGALVLWDLCHSAGAVPIELDANEVDLAVGCGYKYLGGGPGAPAFAYVAARLLPAFAQPIQGWLGSARPFEMGQGYAPADGVRRVLSGTPPILATVALEASLELIAEAGIPAIRAKGVALTEHAIALADELIPDARLASPRDPARRGAHVTLDHPAFEAIMPRLWERGVIPDFRRPDGIRLGLSPLTTSFAEVEVGVRAIAEELARLR
ncbi:kynureninase [Schumannella sp. 10F1B-5-1]|uniref:kynureninase n=1 Tax=Schumannella sp. 10F1B-5-1 TaxID=2590780 RepID=UPI0011324566|nr:aminotransferase class V-fold PLP-dependent enzyme [Schumannella sp. 10F1B-5-1]TPW78453.1 aminotransferase class V-fold PLP-dependent enzyme [Schumannella sp. 10F1B-5-1]